MRTPWKYVQAGYDRLEFRIEEFEKKFIQNDRLPQSRDWRPFRLAVRDILLGWIVIRQNIRDSVLEVDVCLTADPKGVVHNSGAKIVTTALLSDAYKSGTSMGIRFTRYIEDGRVPIAIFSLANHLGVRLKHVNEGHITPKEARHLYLALTGFSPEAERRVMELSLLDKVSPERVCYMVHHLTWTKEEMESILLGSEYPERIILGNVTPEEYHLYHDAVLRARAAILGGFLDRKLRLKEVVQGEVVIDLEGNDRRIDIRFDPRFFAKVYQTREDTPIPWTVQRDWVVPADERLVALVRARDWPDFEAYFERDLEAAKALVKAYKDDTATHFFMLVPRNVFDLPGDNLEGYRLRLEEIGVKLMVCPETVALLDEDVIGRLWESRVMRHDIGTGEGRQNIAVQPRPSLFNSTEVTLVALRPNLQIEGVRLLPQLVEQALYDEVELRRGVNKRNVQTRYHRVCDRMQFLAHQALLRKYRRLHLGTGYLDALSALHEAVPELAREQRLLAGFVTLDQMSDYTDHLDRAMKQFLPDNPELQKALKFIRRSQERERLVVAVHDKHATPQTKTVEKPVSDLTRAFQGQFVPDWVNDYQDMELSEVTAELVWQAVDSARCGQSNGVNFTETPHPVVTKTLHEFVYKEPRDIQVPLSINIVYTDGSQARPFPLFCLKPRSGQEMKALRQLKPLQIGMISCRHPEMDSMIHHYWFRNIEVSVSHRPSAETDEFCYQRTKEKLAVIRQRGELVRLAFYQTGFQIPLIGFWRAVTEFLMEDQGKPPVLEILPYFYQGNRGRDERYQHGEPWH